jgi:hypothetical protein
MRGLLRGTGVLAAVAAVLIVPAAVRGDDGEGPPPLTGFRLQASNGFELYAIGVPPPEGTGAGDGTGGSIGLYLERGRSVVTYAAPATVTPSRSTQTSAAWEGSP